MECPGTRLVGDCFLDVPYNLEQVVRSEARIVWMHGIPNS